MVPIRTGVFAAEPHIQTSRSLTKGSENILTATDMVPNSGNLISTCESNPCLQNNNMKRSLSISTESTFKDINIKRRKFGTKSQKDINSAVQTTSHGYMTRNRLKQQHKENNAVETSTSTENELSKKNSSRNKSRKDKRIRRTVSRVCEKNLQLGYVLTSGDPQCLVKHQATQNKKDLPSLFESDSESENDLFQTNSNLELLNEVKGESMSTPDSEFKFLEFNKNNEVKKYINKKSIIISPSMPQKSYQSIKSPSLSHQIKVLNEENDTQIEKKINDSIEVPDLCTFDEFIFQESNQIEETKYVNENNSNKLLEESDLCPFDEFNFQENNQIEETNNFNENNSNKLLEGSSITNVKPSSYSTNVITTDVSNVEKNKDNEVTSHKLEVLSPIHMSITNVKPSSYSTNVITTDVSNVEKNKDNEVASHKLEVLSPIHMSFPENDFLSMFDVPKDTKNMDTSINSDSSIQANVMNGKLISSPAFESSMETIDETYDIQGYDFETSTPDQPIENHLVSEKNNLSEIMNTCLITQNNISPNLETSDSVTHQYCNAINNKSKRKSEIVVGEMENDNLHSIPKKIKNGPYDSKCQCKLYYNFNKDANKILTSKADHFVFNFNAEKYRQKVYHIKNLEAKILKVLITKDYKNNIKSRKIRETHNSILIHKMKEEKSNLNENNHIEPNILNMLKDVYVDFEYLPEYCDNNTDGDNESQELETIKKNFNISKNKVIEESTKIDNASTVHEKTKIQPTYDIPYEENNMNSNKVKTNDKSFKFQKTKQNIHTSKNKPIEDSMHITKMHDDSTFNGKPKNKPVYHISHEENNMNSDKNKTNNASSDFTKTIKSAHYIPYNQNSINSSNNKNNDNAISLDTLTNNMVPCNENVVDIVSMLAVYETQDNNFILPKPSQEIILNPMLQQPVFDQHNESLFDFLNNDIEDSISNNGSDDDNKLQIDDIKMDAAPIKSISSINSEISDETEIKINHQENIKSSNSNMKSKDSHYAQKIISPISQQVFDQPNKSIFDLPNIKIEDSMIKKSYSSDDDNELQIDDSKMYTAPIKSIPSTNSKISDEIELKINHQANIKSSNSNIKSKDSNRTKKIISPILQQIFDQPNKSLFDLPNNIIEDSISNRSYSSDDDNELQIDDSKMYTAPIKSIPSTNSKISDEIELKINHQANIKSSNSNIKSKDSNRTKKIISPILQQIFDQPNKSLFDLPNNIIEDSISNRSYSSDDDNELQIDDSKMYTAPIKSIPSTNSKISDEIELKINHQANIKSSNSNIKSKDSNRTKKIISPILQQVFDQPNKSLFDLPNNIIEDSISNGSFSSDDDNKLQIDDGKMYTVPIKSIPSTNSKISDETELKINHKKNIKSSNSNIKSKDSNRAKKIISPILQQVFDQPNKSLFDLPNNIIEDSISNESYSSDDDNKLQIDDGKMYTVPTKSISSIASNISDKTELKINHKNNIKSSNSNIKSKDSNCAKKIISPISQQVFDQSNKCLFDLPNIKIEDSMIKKSYSSDDDTELQIDDSKMYTAPIKPIPLTYSETVETEIKMKNQENCKPNICLEKFKYSSCTDKIISNIEFFDNKLINQKLEQLTELKPIKNEKVEYEEKLTETDVSNNQCDNLLLPKINNSCLNMTIEMCNDFYRKKSLNKDISSITNLPKTIRDILKEMYVDEMFISSCQHMFEVCDDFQVKNESIFSQTENICKPSKKSACDIKLEHVNIKMELNKSTSSVNSEAILNGEMNNSNQENNEPSIPSIKTKNYKSPQKQNIVKNNMKIRVQLREIINSDKPLTEILESKEFRNLRFFKEEEIAGTIGTLIFEQIFDPPEIIGLPAFKVIYNQTSDEEKNHILRSTRLSISCPKITKLTTITVVLLNMLKSNTLLDLILNVIKKNLLNKKMNTSHTIDHQLMTQTAYFADICGRLKLLKPLQTFIFDSMVLLPNKYCCVIFICLLIWKNCLPRSVNNEQDPVIITVLSHLIAKKMLISEQTVGRDIFQTELTNLLSTHLNYTFSTDMPCNFIQHISKPDFFISVIVFLKCCHPKDRVEFMVNCLFPIFDDYLNTQQNETNAIKTMESINMSIKPFKINCNSTVATYLNKCKGPINGSKKNEKEHIYNDMYNSYKTMQIKFIAYLNDRRPRSQLFEESLVSMIMTLGSVDYLTSCVSLVKWKPTFKLSAVLCKKLNLFKSLLGHALWDKLRIIDDTDTIKCLVNSCILKKDVYNTIIKVYALR